MNRLSEQRLIAIGDSITLGHWDPAGGWIARLRTVSDERVDETLRADYAAVYNLGISSNVSRQVGERLEREVLARLVRNELEEAFIVIAVGINDSQYKDDRPLYEARAYRDNLTHAVASAKRITPQVLVVGLTPVVERLTDPVGWDPSKAFRNERISIFNEVAREVAAGEDVRFADLFEEPELRTPAAHPSWDGLHFNGQGHARIASVVAAELELLGWRTGL